MENKKVVFKYHGDWYNVEVELSGKRLIVHTYDKFDSEEVIKPRNNLLARTRATDLQGAYNRLAVYYTELEMYSDKEYGRINRALNKAHDKAIAQIGGGI